MARASLVFRELTRARFADLEQLFGANGACGGCWCMWWRLTSAEYGARRGERNRRALASLVEGGTVPGLLAYDGRTPVGWIAIEPRSAYPRLSRSRNLKPIDDVPVWSVTCFYVAPSHRRRGVTERLLEEAARHAFSRGAPAVEAYPIASVDGRSASQLYTGVLRTFERVGFQVVARPSRSRAVVRLVARSRVGRGGRRRGAHPPTV
jgi:GNAT superfamily N-acetyltransferase